MKYLKIKDTLHRQNFKKFELQYKLKYFVYKNILSFINKNNSISVKNKKLIFFHILKKKKKKFFNKNSSSLHFNESFKKFSTI